ncbi:hypothetical protein IM543_07225 [Massilia sp. UMI-21]|nr:hypothetical protein IM543_07225 [Massilia sp. UMI-21]
MIRTTFLPAAAAALITLSAAGVAGAAPQGADAGRVDIVGAQQARIGAFTFHSVQGQYELDDGRILRITGTRHGEQRKLYADFGDGPTEIVRVGKYRFAAMDKDVRLSFEQSGLRRMPDTVRITSPDGRLVALAQR